MGTLSDENARRLGIYTPPGQGSLGDVNAERFGVFVEKLTSVKPVSGGNLSDINAARVGVDVSSLVDSSFFDPTTISGLQLWLKADSLSLNNNDPVSSWSDSSGQGNHYTQATAGNKPLFKTNIIGSLPGVLFDGVDDWLRCALSNVVINPWTVLIVVQPTLNSGSQKAYATLFHTRSGTPQGAFISVSVAGSKWGGYTDAGDLVGATALVAGSNYLLEETSTTNTYLYERGVQVAFTNNSSIGTGTESSIGKDQSTTNREYAGYIFELLAYNSVLSAANRQYLENGLIAKWTL